MVVLVVACVFVCCMLHSWGFGSRKFAVLNKIMVCWLWGFMFVVSSEG